MTINADTVEALLETVRGLAATEEERGRSLNSQAGALLGFNGVIMALLGAQAAVVGHGLGGLGTPLAGGLVLLAVAATARSASACMQVLRPRELWHIDMRYIQQFPTLLVKETRAAAQKSIMTALINQMIDESETNAEKRGQLRSAFRWLLTALALLVCEGVILVTTSFGL
jgi:hypothetical protein